MKRLGLALSGGGFRAVLYHLGLARTCAMRKILPSGDPHLRRFWRRSIFAAHLVPSTGTA